MAVRAWLQKNQVFDRDLVRLFPEYGVTDPDVDLKDLSEDKWDEMKSKLMTDRAAELKDPRGRDRMLKKLTKVEKLWKNARSPGKHGKTKHHNKSASKLSSASTASSDSKEKETSTKKTKHKSAKSSVMLQSSLVTPSPADAHDTSNSNSSDDEDAVRQQYTAKCEELNRTRQMFEEYRVQRSNDEKELSSATSALQTKYDALQSEHQSMHDRMQQLDEKCEALQQLKQQQPAPHESDTSSHNNALQSNYDDLLQKHQTLTNNIATLKQSQDQSRSLQLEFDAYKQDTQKQQQEETQSLKTKIAELQADAGDKAHMIAALQTKETALQTQLQPKHETETNGMDAHIQRHGELEHELEAAKKELDLKEKFKMEMEENLKAQLAAKENECAELRVSADTSSNALNDKLLQLEVQLENEQEKNGKLSKQLQDATQEKKTAKKSEHRRYEHLYAQFEEHKESTSAERTQFEHNEIALRDEISELKLEQNKTRIANTRLQNKVNLLKESVSQREEDCSELKEQLDALQEEHEHHNSSLKSSSNNHGENKTEKLKELNKTLEAKYKRKAAQYSKLLSDYNEFVMQNSEDSENMTASMEQLRRDYAALEDKYKAAHNELESMKQMYERDNGNSNGKPKQVSNGDAELAPLRRKKQKPKKKRKKPRAMTVATGEEHFNADEVDVKPAKVEDVSGDDMDQNSHESGDEDSSAIDDDHGNTDDDDGDGDDEMSTKSKKGHKKKYKPRLKTPRHKLQQSSSSPTSDTAADSATDMVMVATDADVHIDE